MCAQGGRASTIKFDCALAQTELYASRVVTKMSECGKEQNKNVIIRLLYSESEAANQNQKFSFHFLSDPCRKYKERKENFWVLPARVRERVRGAIGAYD